MCLSNQLNSDINNLDNHKYIAHQIALLYVSNVHPSAFVICRSQAAHLQNMAVLFPDHAKERVLQSNIELISWHFLTFLLQMLIIIFSGHN